MSPLCCKMCAACWWVPPGDGLQILSWVSPGTEPHLNNSLLGTEAWALWEHMEGMFASACHSSPVSVAATSAGSSPMQLAA